MPFHIPRTVRSSIRQLLLSTHTLSAARSLRSFLRDRRASIDRSPAQVDPHYNARVANELATFEHNEIVHDLPQIFHYWSNKYLLPTVTAFGFVHPDDFFIKQFEKLLESNQDAQLAFVSIGAGNCDTEVRIAQSLISRGYVRFKIECIDINPAMLERGKQHAKEAGCSDHLSFSASDFNSWQPSKSYHAVMANQSLHHVVNLEGLFASVRKAIEPTNGTFITSDMIGRNGHQRWPEALAIVNEFWEKLPERYKYNHQLKRTDTEFVNWDCATEGFEGIRAQDVLPLLMKNFHFDLFIPFANVISPFIDRSYGYNFDADSPEDLALIDTIHMRDVSEMASGRIKPTQMFAVLSLDHKRPCACIPGLEPEHCVRHVVAG
jgi:2-polyprenyl-3-methyl-5-hydroxy-6-metoxy-1,4-benzoquinol methylase